MWLGTAVHLLLHFALRVHYTAPKVRHKCPAAVGAVAAESVAAAAAIDAVAAVSSTYVLFTFPPLPNLVSTTPTLAQ